MSQTSVRTSYAVGIIDGSPADDGPIEKVSGRNDEASASIPFGVVVKSGTTESGCLNLTATSNVLKGVSCYSTAYAPVFELDADGAVLPDVMFDVAVEGRLNVYPEESVTPASEVHVRAVAAGDEVAGAFRATADGTDTIDVSAFCRWVSPGSSTVAAVIEFDFTGAASAVADT